MVEASLLEEGVHTADILLASGSPCIVDLARSPVALQALARDRAEAENPWPFCKNSVHLEHQMIELDVSKRFE